MTVEFRDERCHIRHSRLVWFLDGEEQIQPIVHYPEGIASCDIPDHWRRPAG